MTILHCFQQFFSASCFSEEANIDGLRSNINKKSSLIVSVAVVSNDRNSQEKVSQMLIDLTVLILAVQCPIYNWNQEKLKNLQTNPFYGLWLN